MRNVGPECYTVAHKSWPKARQSRSQGEKGEPEPELGGKSSGVGTSEKIAHKTRPEGKSNKKELELSQGWCTYGIYKNLLGV